MRVDTATGEGHLADGDVGALSRDLADAALTMARHFHTGATMWCVSPSWPHHARHVAVEFVHPVIVGKPALPALIGPVDDTVAGLRVSVAPGDLVIAISGPSDPDVVDLLRRTHAWGVATVWIGSGERPPAGAADHTLWLEDAPLTAPFDGRFILLYHLLWELTHVCLEHRGQLTTPALDCEEETCITCSDEGELAEVVAVSGTEARVRTATGPRTIDVTLVDDVGTNDLLLVHAGSAIARAPDRGFPS